MPLTRYGAQRRSGADIENNADAAIGYAFFLFEIAAAIVTGWFARTRGRSVIGWGLAGLFIPVFALIALLVLPNRRQAGAANPPLTNPAATRQAARTVGARPTNPGWNKAPAAETAPRSGWGKPPAGTKNCPKCSKAVRVEAQSCPYCRFDFNQQR